MNTLITEPKDYSKKAIAAYKELGQVYFLPKLKAEKRNKILKQTDIIVVRLAYKLDSSWFDRMPNLKIIATPTTGLNHVDVLEAKKRGIKIISLRGRTGFLKYITSTAEKSLGLMLSLVCNIPWAIEDVRAGNWNRDAWRGRQLAGKTLGILGLGRLGKMMARYGRALGMKVISADPQISEAAMKRYGVSKVDHDILFKESDVLSVHVLLTDATYNLVKAWHLKMMKPTAYLINTARGEIIEKGALEKALKNKWIAGAAIDVMWDESADGAHLKGSPLWHLARKEKNFIITPHTGGATHEAMTITEEFIADLVKKHCRR